MDETTARAPARGAQGSPVRTQDRVVYNLLRFAEHFAGRDARRMARAKRWIAAAKRRHHDAILRYAGKHRLGRALPIDARNDIEPAEFIDNYLYGARPLVIRGIARRWRCCRLWTPQYFNERCGDDRVILVNDHITTDESIEEEIRLRDVINGLDTPLGKYARFVPILANHPEFFDDFDTAWLAGRIDRNARVRLWGNKGRGRKLRSHLFIGAKEKKTEVHCALTNNFFINVYGRKRWFLISPEFNPYVYSPVNWAPGAFGTEATPLNPNDERFPLWRYVDYHEILLEPGDVLFNPPFWWHHVTNMSESIAVGIRWYDFRSAMAASVTQNLLSLMATNPTLRYAAKNAVEYGKMHGKKKRRDLRTAEERLRDERFINEL